MSSGVKVGGVWKVPAQSYVKVNGVWKAVATMSGKTGGAWKPTTFSSPPAAPIMGWVSAGLFSVTNPVAGAVYTAVNVSGGGTAVWDAVNSRFTVSAPDSRWSVTAGWASNGPQTAPDFMERKARTSDYIPYTQCYNPCGNCRTDTNPHTWSCGCGTGCNDSGGGQWGDCICRGPGYYQDHNYGPAGYSDGGSEWFKVS